MSLPAHSHSPSSRRVREVPLLRSIDRGAARQRRQQQQDEQYQHQQQIDGAHTVDDDDLDGFDTLGPFAALSPNLSQLAFTLRDPPPPHDAAGGVNLQTDSCRIELSSLVDEDGLPRWDGFSHARIEEWNSQQSMKSRETSTSQVAPDQATTNVYTASSAFISAACDAVHRWMSHLSPVEFTHRYGRLLPMSQHASMVIELFQLFHDGCQQSHDSNHIGLSSPVVFMILSCHIERLIGDIFCARRASTGIICPRMLRDLFLAKEVNEFIPQELLHLLQSLCGSPKSYNIRNILWHGFLGLTCEQTHDALAKFTSMLWLVFVGLLNECTRIWDRTQVRSPVDLPEPLIAIAGCASTATSTSAEGQTNVTTSASSSVASSSQQIPSDTCASAVASTASLPYRRPLKSKFPGDAPLLAHLTSTMFTHATTSTPSSPSSSSSSPSSSDPFSYWPISPSMVFDSSDSSFASLTSDLSVLLRSSYILPSHRVDDLLSSFRLLRSNPYIGVTILLPTLEQVMRHAFVYSNGTIRDSNSGRHIDNPNIAEGMLLAQTEKLFTTLDLVLYDTVQPLDETNDADVTLAASPEPNLIKCGRTSAFAFPIVPGPCSFQPDAPQRNQLYLSKHTVMPALPGSGVLYAMIDLLISRVGPRLRDRIAHGEIRWDSSSTLPSWMAVWCFNIILGLAVRFPLRLADVAPVDASSVSLRSAIVDRAHACFNAYQPALHPRAIFMQSMVAIKRGADEIDSLARQRANRPDADAEEGAEDTAIIQNPDGSTYAPRSRASPRDWYRFAQSESPTIVESRSASVLLTSDLDDLIVASNICTVRSCLAIRQLRSSHPNMPLWSYITHDMSGGDTSAHSADTSSTLTPSPSPLPIEWWSLGSHPFWREAHVSFHHATDPTCSLACELHCFDRCMSHPPVIALQRILDSLAEIPSIVNEAHQTLQHEVRGGDARANKRKLLASVDCILPSIVFGLISTLAGLMILFHQLFVKAHPPHPHPNPNSDLPHADPLTRLRDDRAIARVLKKAQASVERIRASYQKNRWLHAAQEWTELTDAIQAWRNTFDQQIHT